MPTKRDFQTELRRQLAHARNLGQTSLDVNAGKLHRDVGEYPGPDHRMPVCRDAMIDEMKPNDRILTQPPKGHDATLTIRYSLPR